MEIITIYGVIEKDKIFSDNQIYNLKVDSLVCTKTKGWFWICKSNNCYQLLRVLKKVRAEIYSEWTDE